MHNNLIFLLTIHCLADYPLQGDFLANMKGKNKFLLIIHCFIWAGMIYGAANFLGITQNPSWFVFLFMGHYLIDLWKCNRTDKTKALTTDLYIDQAGHLFQIIVLLALA
jgi:hypothetical protein